MAERKTQETSASVDDFIAAVASERRRRECHKLDAIMRGITGCDARMWGASIVGYGRYSYRYADGREGTMMLTGFSPRKQALSVYIMPGFSRYEDLMGRLGKHKAGRSCLYINKLEDVDLAVLEDLIRLSVAHMKEKYGV